jgi:hypothetical protein
MEKDIQQFENVMQEKRYVRSILKTRKQHPNIRIEHKLVANTQKTLQHVACVFAKILTCVL